MAFFEAFDGTSLFYREWGAGEPILFLSGLGMGTPMWDYQFVAFAEQGFRCIGLDRRGHGRSDQPPSGYDIDTLADDIAALIEKLQLDRLTLVGHSMAGGEIVRYLTRHRNGRVSRMVLVAPTTPKLLQDDDNPQGVPRAQLEMLLEQWRQDYPKWIDENTAPFFIPETSRPMMRWTAGLMQTPVPIVLACGRSLIEADFRAEMRRIEIPSLVIHGDRDRSMPVQITGGPSAQLLPNGSLLVYEGGPHGLMFTHQERFNADLLRFIREH